MSNTLRPLVRAAAFGALSLVAATGLAITPVSTAEPMAQEAPQTEQLRLLMAEATKESVLYSLWNGDPKVLSKTIEDAITNVNADRNKGALTVCMRFGRSAELRHALKLVDHEDEELAKMAALAMLRSSDIKHVKDILKHWDKLEAENPSRAEIIRDQVSHMNMHGEALKELMHRAKNSKFPDQAKAATLAMDLFIGEDGLKTVEDTEKAFKKIEFQKLLKGRQMPQSLPAGAKQLIIPDIGGNLPDFAGGNLVVRNGNTFEQTLEHVERTEKDGFLITFKVYVHSAEDSVELGITYKGNGRRHVQTLSGDKHTIDGTSDGGTIPFKAAGTWVEVKLWWLPFHQTGPKSMMYIGNKLVVTGNGAGLWESYAEVPKVVFTSKTGSAAISMGEIKLVTKGP